MPRPTVWRGQQCHPGFDVIDYGQEGHVFGILEKDALHWNTTFLERFQTHADTLALLYN